MIHVDENGNRFIVMPGDEKVALTDPGIHIKLETPLPTVNGGAVIVNAWDALAIHATSAKYWYEKYEAAAAGERMTTTAAAYAEVRDALEAVELEAEERVLRSAVAHRDVDGSVVIRYLVDGAPQQHIVTRAELASMPIIGTDPFALFRDLLRDHLRASR